MESPDIYDNVIMHDILWYNVKYIISLYRSVKVYHIRSIRLLFISSRNFVRLLFESGYYSRVAFIKVSGIGKVVVIRFSNFSTYLVIIRRAEGSPPLSVQFAEFSLRLFRYIYFRPYVVHVLLTRNSATRILAAASIRERRLFRSAHPEVRRQFESGD